MYVYKLVLYIYIVTNMLSIADIDRRDYVDDQLQRQVKHATACMQLHACNCRHATACIQLHACNCRHAAACIQLQACNCMHATACMQLQACNCMHATAGMQLHDINKLKRIQVNNWTLWNTATNINIVTCDRWESNISGLHTVQHKMMEGNFTIYVQVDFGVDKSTARFDRHDVIYKFRIAG